MNKLTTIFPSRKITPPLIDEERILRKRLLAYFDKIENTGFILVSAPAGYGKTTLLANWAEECKQPVAWISLDKGDNDEIHFWLLVIEALRSATSNQKAAPSEPLFGASTYKILDANRDDSQTFSRTENIVSNLICEIEQLDLGSFWLILDDYHLIQNKFIHHGISHLIKYQPAALHIAIGTRIDPPFGLEKMRACNQIIEIRHTSLSFTIEEAQYYLNEYSALQLEDADISNLVKRTHGWISALQLSAGALRSHPDPAQFISALTGEFESIANFLAAEVYNNQIEEIKTFLLYTSVLDWLSGPVCDFILSSSGSLSILQGMRWSDIPIEGFDVNHQFFKYQNLFADMLRQRLRNEDPQKHLELHATASRWFVDEARKTGESNLLIMGIEHALSSRDFDRTASLLDEHALQLVGSGFESILVDWVSRVPIEYLFNSPILSAYHMYNLLASGNMQKAEQHLDKFTEYSLLNHQGDQDLNENNIRQEILFALQAHISAHGTDLDQSIQLANHALRELPKNLSFWYVGSLLALAGAHMMKGDMAAALKIYDQAFDTSRRQDSPYLVCVTDIKKLGGLFYKGDMAQIENIYQNFRTSNSSIQLSDRLFGGILESQYSLVLCEFNRLDEAHTTALLGLEKSEAAKNYYVLPISWLAMIQIQFSKGDQEGIDESIANLEKISRQVTLVSWTEKRLKAWKTRSLLRQENLSKARSLIDLWEISIKPELHFLEEELNLAHARLLIAEGNLIQANKLLSRLLLDAEKGGRNRKEIEIHCLLAQVHSRQENQAAALAQLDQALKLAEPFDYLRIFLDEGDWLMDLIAIAGESGLHTNYCKTILQSYLKSKRQNSRSQGKLITSLSQREWDVLELLEKRMTNDAIAAKLVISTSTVRTHLRSIFRKLGVHRRWDAVEKAREINLL